MRILHVISSVDPRQGGTLDAVASLSAAWSRQGHVCHVACLDHPRASWMPSGGPLPVSAVGRRKSWDGLGAGYGYCARWKSWLGARAADYDVVILHGLWNYASFGSWRALRSSPVPYFVFTHGMLDPYFSRADPIKGLLKAGFWRLFEHRVLRDAAGVLFTSREERNLAARSFRPYKATPFVVGLGTADEAGDPAAHRQALLQVAPQLASRHFILFLGRIHPKKGPDLLLRAFAEEAAKRPDLDLVIAGPDPVGLKAEVQQLASSLEINSRVHWLGMLSGDAKWGALRSAEFLALPSHQENFGIVLAESLMLGTPVLTTNKVNIWEEIEEDRTGIVVADDVAGVCGGLQRMCSLSADQREEMRRNARQSFLRRFDIEAVAAGLLKILASTKNETGSRRHDRAIFPGSGGAGGARSPAGSDGLGGLESSDGNR